MIRIYDSIDTKTLSLVAEATIASTGLTNYKVEAQGPKVIVKGPDGSKVTEICEDKGKLSVVYSGIYDPRLKQLDKLKDPKSLEFTNPDGSLKPEYKKASDKIEKAVNKATESKKSDKKETSQVVNAVKGAAKSLTEEVKKGAADMADYTATTALGPIGYLASELVKAAYKGAKKADSFIGKISDARSSADLKNEILALGLDPTGKSVKEMEQVLSMALWAKDHPGEEFPEQYDPLLAKDSTKASKDWINKNFKSTDWLIQEKCFVKGTLIATVQGYKPIEEFKEGDRLFTTDGNSQVIEGRVVRASTRSYEGKIVTLTGEGYEFQCTDDHRIFTSHGWCEAKDIVVGERVRCYNLAENKHSTRQIKYKKVEYLHIDVYCLNTTPGHDYFVTESNVRVHNCNGLRSILEINGSKVRMTSRSRSVVNYMFNEHQDHVLGFEDIKNPFKGKTVLDGELMSKKTRIDTGETVSESPLQAVVALVHMNAKDSIAVQEKYDRPLIYKAFDVLYYNGENVQELPYEERDKLAASAVELLLDANPDLSIMKIPTITDYDEAYQVFQDFIAKGAEGIMLKKRGMKYQQGKRSGDMMKLKGFITVDGYISGAVPSSKDKGFADLIGGFKISSIVDGKETEIAAISNIPLDVRRAATVLDENGEPQLNPEYYHKVVEMVGQEFGKNKRLGSARINEWRPDRDWDSCKLTEEDIKPKDWTVKDE